LKEQRRRRAFVAQETGTAASRMAPSTRTKAETTLHPTHFIDVSVPLVLDRLPGTRRLTTSIIRMHAPCHCLKFSFPGFVFLMCPFLRRTYCPVNFWSGFPWSDLTLSNHFVQLTRQRINAVAAIVKSPLPPT